MSWESLLVKALQMALEQAAETEEGTGVYDERYVSANVVLAAWLAEQKLSPDASVSAGPSAAGEVHREGEAMT